MSLGTKDLPAIEQSIEKAEGREKWLLQVARLYILMPEGVPIEVLARDWGISEAEAEARMEEINTLEDARMVEPADAG